MSVKTSKVSKTCQITSKWVGITWGLHGDEKLIKILCGADVGLPTQAFVEWGASHAIPTQGFLNWGLRGADLRG